MISERQQPVFKINFMVADRWNYRHEILSGGFVVNASISIKRRKQAIALAIFTHHKDVETLISIEVFVWTRERT